MSKSTMLSGTIKKVIIFVLVVIVAFVGISFAIGKLYPIEFEDYVSKYSNEYGVDETLFYAVIKTESNFDPEAVSSVNAKGLMQLTEDTFNWVRDKMGVEGYLYTYNDIFTPEVNIKYGTYLLSILIEEYDKDEATALCAYNAGRGTVNKWLGTASSSNGKKLDAIPSASIESYVNKVLRNKDIYKFRLGK